MKTVVKVKLELTTHSCLRSLCTRHQTESTHAVWCWHSKLGWGSKSWRHPPTIPSIHGCSLGGGCHSTLCCRRDVLQQVWSTLDKIVQCFLNIWIVKVYECWHAGITTLLLLLSGKTGPTDSTQTSPWPRLDWVCPSIPWSIQKTEYLGLKFLLLESICVDCSLFCRWIEDGCFSDFSCEQIKKQWKFEQQEQDTNDKKQ